MDQTDIPTDAALFLSAFFDELTRCGVQDVVVSPGSRSTPLSMVAYESELSLHIDIDERGAAFFALGLAKASGRPVCAICTSGTAVANYYPAVLEAESSRVPLILLTGDRPPLLQNLGAPQTCDQLKIFGDHVRLFQQMPLPGSNPHEIAFARQMALAAFSASVGSHASVDECGNAWYGCISDAGPVHMNFPLDEPLKPNMEAEGLFVCGRRSIQAGSTGTAASLSEAVGFYEVPGRGTGGPGSAKFPAVSTASAFPDEKTIAWAHALLQEKRTLVLCGEGSCANRTEADLLVRWSRIFDLPLVADPLSNLRSYGEPLVIDNYDNLFGTELCPDIDLVIRFGRYPVSKACFSALNKTRPPQIVVDACETRDFNSSTDAFIRCTPMAFVASMLYRIDQQASDRGRQLAFARSWIKRNDSEASRIAQVSEVESDFAGAFIYRLFKLVPEGACVFSASSMAIRMIDTFYLKSDKRISLLCNRGLNGIDGSLSSAIGAAHCFEHTVFVTGDLAFLHDINALALQRELMLNHAGGAIPNIIIALMNNHGGGIFDMLPQRSDDPSFRRLFLTPQDVSFSDVALGFDVPYARARTVEDFEVAYRRFLGKAGIHIIEIVLPSSGLKERYGHFLA